jgi:hypothetical protein
MKPVFIIVMAIILLIPTSAFAQSSGHWSDELYTWHDYRLIEESQLNNALIYLQDRAIIEIVIHSTEPADFIASVLDQRAGTSVPTASTLSADDYKDTKDCFDTLGVDGLTVEEKSVCQRIDREYVWNGSEGNWQSYEYIGYNYGYDYSYPYSGYSQYDLDRAMDSLDYYSGLASNDLDRYYAQYQSGSISYEQLESSYMSSLDYYGEQYANSLYP